MSKYRNEKHDKQMEVAEQPVNAFHPISRREFVAMMAFSAFGALASCAVNPVTGKSQFMLVSEDTEIQIDRQNSPYQFSADYGVAQDTGLNRYIEQVGKKMAALTHRPRMPYSFQVVNATYINAYAFPGGSIAATRGILLSLENEAELAALLGHELGHVNARHTAQQMSKSMVTQVVVGGVAVVAGAKDPVYGNIAASLGMIGAGALLASYSRDNEREADALGLSYMVKCGYGPQGFEGLMDMLRRMSQYKPNAIELMFATHPMSDERYQTAVSAIRQSYSAYETNPLYRERYMDNTKDLRKIKGAIEAMQTSDRKIAEKDYSGAEDTLRQALGIAPRDYTALVMMAKCQLLQEKFAEADRYAEKARQVNPREGQGYHLGGFAKMKQKKFDAALNLFDAYEKKLPGSPNTLFFRGYCLEGMQREKESAQAYIRYLKAVNQGEYAQHAYQKLVDWGYVKPSPASQ